MNQSVMKRIRLMVLWLVVGVVLFFLITESWSREVPINETIDRLIDQENLLDTVPQLEAMQEELTVVADLAPDNTDILDGYYDRLEAWSSQWNFTALAALYQREKDVQYLPQLIDEWMRVWEFETIRDWLADLDLNDPEVVAMIGVERVVKVLFTITPLTIKSYEPLKDVVDQYNQQWLLTSGQKSYYYSMVALAKGHRDDFEYFSRKSNLQSQIELIDLVSQSQEQYQYAPERYSLGLYGIDAYTSGRYRTSYNIAKILQNNDPVYQLGRQLEARSSVMLADWQSVVEASQHLQWLVQERADTEQYLYLEAVWEWHRGDIARAVVLFSQLDQTEYSYHAARYQVLIALDEPELLLWAIERLLDHPLEQADYYTLISLLYPPYNIEDPEVIGRISDVIEACPGEIASQSNYICLMGKAGLIAHGWEADKAIRLLKQLTTTYPTTITREYLWNLLDQQWEQDQARRAYLQAIRFARGDQSDTETKARILPRVQQQ